MRVEAPDQEEALGAVEASDVIVVSGVYDRVERVLVALDVPFTVVAPEQLGQLSLSPHQLLVINCPGNLPPAGLRPLERFVAEGGSLFTTDLALRHVIEPVFPGVLAYNERPTADDVVRIEVRAHDNPFLAGMGRRRSAVVARGLLLPDPDRRSGTGRGAACEQGAGGQVRRVPRGPSVPPRSFT
jgi:hypothetical protein